MEGKWEDYPSDWLGCGTVEHGPECLCDVKIGKPITTVHDWVNEIWMGPQLCEIRGYGAPWTSAMLADYLTDLGKFHAALKLHGMDNNTGSLGVGLLEDARFANSVNVRSAVRDMMERMTEPALADALYILGVSAKQFLDSASQFKMQDTESWNLERIKEFESDLLAHMRIPAVCKKYNMSESTYNTIKEYLRPVFSARKVPFFKMNNMERNIARKRAVELIAEGKDNASIIRDIEELCGVKYTSAAISKLRVRKFPRCM